MCWVWFPVLHAADVTNCGLLGRRNLLLHQCWSFFRRGPESPDLGQLFRANDHFKLLESLDGDIAPAVSTLASSIVTPADWCTDSDAQSQPRADEPRIPWTGFHKVCFYKSKVFHIIFIHILYTCSPNGHVRACQRFDMLPLKTVWHLFFRFNIIASVNFIEIDNQHVSEMCERVQILQTTFHTKKVDILLKLALG